MISNTALFEKKSDYLNEEPTFLRLLYLWGLRNKDVVGRSYYGIFLTEERARLSAEEAYFCWENSFEIVKLPIGVINWKNYKEVKE